MSDTKDGGSAFPIPLCNEPGAYPAEPGMSLRDYFAAAAMTGQSDVDAGRRQKIAENAYAMADAMLKARESRHD